jgi:hypothetical protein
MLLLLLATAVGAQRTVVSGMVTDGATGKPLAGASSEPVNVGLKVKPYISVNNQQLAYPDYISMNKVLN